MAQTQTGRLVYVKPADMAIWDCRPLEAVEVLDLQERKVGRLGGLILDAHAHDPRFIVVERALGKGHKWFVVPVGDAWFDETERAIRIDVNLRRDALPFDPDEFAAMTPEQAASWELAVLGNCCPEVGVHKDGTPDYTKLANFQCPAWLRAPNARV